MYLEAGISECRTIVVPTGQSPCRSGIKFGRNCLEPFSSWVISNSDRTYLGIEVDDALRIAEQIKLLPPTIRHDGHFRANSGYLTVRIEEK